MATDKYPSIFSGQMEATVYIMIFISTHSLLCTYPSSFFSIQQPSLLSCPIWNSVFLRLSSNLRKRIILFVSMTGIAITIKIAFNGKRAQGSSHVRHSPVLITQCIRCDFRKTCGFSAFYFITVFLSLC